MEQKNLEQQGARIADARKNKNMTQEQLANLLHVGKQAVSNWENGKNDLDPDTMRRLERILGIQLQHRKPQTTVEFCTEGIKDLRQIQNIREFKAQVETVMDQMPFDAAYGASVRRILTLLFYATHMEHTIIFIKNEFPKEFEKNFPYSWTTAAFFLTGIFGPKTGYGTREEPPSPEKIKKEECLNVYVQKIAKRNSKKAIIGIRTGSFPRKAKDDEKDWYEDLRKIGCAAATDLLHYGMLPEYNTGIGLSLRVAIYNFAEICRRIDCAIGVTEPDEDTDVLTY